MKRSILILALLCSIITLQAQTNSIAEQHEQEPEEIMESFFATLEKDVEQALDQLFATNVWVKSNNEITTSLKERFTSSRKLLGNYSGYELVSRYELGTCYRKYSYLLKYDRQPIELVVIMYKPENSWRLQNINFHSDFEKDMIKVEK